MAMYSERSMTMRPGKCARIIAPTLLSTLALVGTLLPAHITSARAIGWSDPLAPDHC
jgi:hypothetical protein